MVKATTKYCKVTVQDVTGNKLVHNSITLSALFGELNVTIIEKNTDLRKLQMYHSSQTLSEALC